MEPELGVEPVVTFVLFPDSRERSGGSRALGELAVRLNRESAHVVRAAHTGDGRFMCALRMGPQRVLAIVQSVDWHHPVLMVYRARGETRWSFATIIGRSSGEEN